MANDGTGLSSVGLMGLPHFRTSRISREMHEPVYVNLFTAEIQLPKKLTGDGGISNEDKNLLLEEVKKVGGLDTNKVPGTVEQNYKFADRSFANSGPDNTHIDVTLDFEVNVRGSSEGAPDMYTVKMLRAWQDLVYDPLTGRQGLKVDYVAPQVVITMHDKAHNPFWQWTLYNVFPTKNLPVPDLDFKSKEIYRITGYTLRCDFWDEVML